MEEAIYTIAGLGVLVAGIAIIFFKVPLNTVETIAIYVSIAAFVISVIVTVIVAFYNGKKDRYGIFNISYKFGDGLSNSIMVGVSTVLCAIWIEILGMIFAKESLANAFGRVLMFGLLSVVGAVASFILAELILFIIDRVYKVRRKIMEQNEKNAHSIWDTIMFEAVDEKMLANRYVVTEYCKKKSGSKTHTDFLKYDFFFKEGLDSLVSSGKLARKVSAYFIPEQYAKAHAEWDPIMLEIVNTQGLLDIELMKEHCTNTTTTSQYKVFLSEQFFFSDGLESLAKEGKVVIKQRHMGKTKKCFYQSKIPAKIAEVSEEISLD